VASDEWRVTSGEWRVTQLLGTRLTFLLNGNDRFCESSDDVIERGNTLDNHLRRKQMTTALIPAQALPGFAPCDLQMLRQFLAESPPIPFFDIGANGVEAAHLLPDQFRPRRSFIRISESVQ